MVCVGSVRNCCMTDFTLENLGNTRCSGITPSGHPPRTLAPNSVLPANESAVEKGVRSNQTEQATPCDMICAGGKEQQILIYSTVSLVGLVIVCGTLDKSITGPS